jgi:hypothetical protein
MNQDTALREVREWAEKYWAAHRDLERLGMVADKAIVERGQLRDEVERLRNALKRLTAVAQEETHLTVYPESFARAAGYERFLVGHCDVDHWESETAECEWCQALAAARAALSEEPKP